MKSSRITLGNTFVEDVQQTTYTFFIWDISKPFSIVTIYSTPLDSQSLIQSHFVFLINQLTLLTIETLKSLADKQD